jgi:hypothetical protein
MMFLLACLSLTDRSVGTFPLYAGVLKFQPRPDGIYGFFTNSHFHIFTFSQSRDGSLLHASPLHVMIQSLNEKAAPGSLPEAAAHFVFISVGQLPRKALRSILPKACFPISLSTKSYRKWIFYMIYL